MALNCVFIMLFNFLFPATTPLTKHLNVAIIDSNPALGGKLCIKREDPPDARVSTVTPATISFFKGIKDCTFSILNLFFFNYWFKFFVCFPIKDMCKGVEV